MAKTSKHLTKKWEISFAELENTVRKVFKVTRRLPELAVAETKMFCSKEEAVRQFNEWLEQVVARSLCFSEVQQVRVDYNDKRQEYPAKECAFACTALETSLQAHAAALPPSQK